MKRLTYLLAGVFVLSVLLSCEKQKIDNNLSDLSESDFLKKAGKTISGPTSDAGIVPVIIPGANNGGNRTCEEVAIAFNTTFDICGERINYSDAGDEFDSEFPEGLEVDVDENGFVSFNTEGGLIIGGFRYTIGAVIVKGSNTANIYYYPNGILSDAGLAAPDGHMLSNITFCLKYQPIYIAVKTFYTAGISYLFFPGTNFWALSDGIKNFKTDDWSSQLGINTFNSEEIKFDIVNTIGPEKIGTVKVDKVGNNLVVFLNLKGDPNIPNDEGLFYLTYLYVGLSQLNYYVAPVYSLWRTNTVVGNNQTFSIPFSDIH